MGTIQRLAAERRQRYVSATEAFTPLDKIRIRKAYKMLTDLRLPVCRSIITILRDGAALSVTDIQTRISWLEDRDIEQCITSRHLALLLAMRLVRYTTDQQRHIYTLDADRLIQIYDAITRFVHPSGDVPSDDAEYLVKRDQDASH